MATTTTKGKQPRGTAWCFTLNNYGAGEYAHLQEMLSGEVWGVMGQEVGESGTPHLQGAVVLRVRHTLEYMRGWNSRAHWEVMAGTPQQSLEYCSKQDSNPFTCGTMPVIPGTKKGATSQGARTDLEKFAANIREHGIQAAVMESPDIYLKYPMGAEKLASRLAKAARMTPRDPPRVVWCYGPTGSGKTRWVKDQSAVIDQWWSGKNLKWWDGYDGESVVIIDDFRRDFCTFHELLRILDRYELRVEVKHGTTMLLARDIYITSAFHPRDVYETREDIEQLMRRITTVLYFGSMIAEDVTSCIETHPGEHKTGACVPNYVPVVDLTRLTAEAEEEHGINGATELGWF